MWSAVRGKNSKLSSYTIEVEVMFRSISDRGVNEVMVCCVRE